MAEHGLIRQFARFALVGVGNTALSWLAYPALLAAGIEPVPAAAAAFGLGALNGYLWNSRWTFASRGRRFAPLRYVIVQLGGMATTSLLVGALAGQVGRYPAYALATVVVTVGTFAANRGWTFACPTRPRPQPIHSLLTESPQRRVLPWNRTAEKGHAR